MRDPQSVRALEPAVAGVLGGKRWSVSVSSVNTTLAYPVPGKETTPLGVLAPFLTLSGRPLINSRYAARINVRVNVVTWSSGPAVCRRSCLRPGCPCTRSDMWTRGRPGGSGQTADQSDPHSHLDRGFSHTGLYRSLNIGPNGNLDANKGS